MDTQPTPPLPKKSSKWLIIAAFIFLLASASVFAYKYYQLKQKLTQVELSPNDLTADWKTYTSSAYIFKYDPSLYLDQISELDTNVDLYNKNPRLTNQTNVYYLSFRTPEKTSFSKEISIMKQAYPNLTYTSKKLNNYTIYEVKGLLRPPGVKEINYFIEGDNILSGISIGNVTETPEPEYVDFLEKVNNILSTFKFTDQETKSTGTVSGKLCYPSDFLPPGEIVAKNIESGKIFTQIYPGSNAGSNSTDAFSFELPPGNYHLRYQAHASSASPEIYVSGYYTCAEKDNTLCEINDSHNHIVVKVIQNKITPDIFLCDFFDWFSPPEQEKVLNKTF